MDIGKITQGVLGWSRKLLLAMLSQTEAGTLLVTTQNGNRLTFNLTRAKIQ